MAVDQAVLDALDAVASGIAAGDLETDTLEFTTIGRSRNDSLTDLAEAAACLANARGGSVIVGVADHPGGPAGIVGCNLDPALTRRAILERTDPPLTVDVTAIDRSEGHVLVIAVPEGATVHSVRNRASERMGNACMPMSTDRIARVVADRRGEDWSDAATNLGINTADALALAVARRFLRESVDPVRRSFADLSDADLLRTAGLVTPQGMLNRAGVLLFADVPERREHLAYMHRRTTSGELTANEQFAGPLLTALGRVFELISARLDSTSVNVGPLVQVQVADLPESAVREAVVNAVMHRDYRDTARVIVEHTATRLAVTSPGPFVSGVTTSNLLTTASRSRNPRLAEAIRKLGLAETAGTGVDRMYAAMARLGHQPPQFESDGATVRVVLSGGAPNQYVARFVATLPAESAEDADTMLILLSLLQARTVTAVRLSPALQKSAAEVQSVLDRLASPPYELVEPTRESARRAQPTYRLRESPLAALGPAVAYRRRTIDSADRRVMELVREASVINSRMVKLVLDTDTVTTSRILADMVERGLLVKTSKAMRGPGVTYGPGPATPRGRRGKRATSPEDPQQ